MKTIKASEHDDEIVTAQSLAQAIDQGRKGSRSALHATTVQFLGTFNALAIGFADQTAVLLPIDNYTELRDLSAEDLDRIELGYAGSALCLPHQDLHIAIAGLISASEPLMTMAASLIATRNGRRSSAAKANASKANGLKGGRPRKVIAAS